MGADGPRAAPFVQSERRSTSEMPRTKPARFHHVWSVFVAVDPLGPPFQATRTWRHVAADPRDTLIVTVLTRGRARFQQAGRDHVATAGELTLLDATRPYDLELPDPFGVRHFQFNKADLGLAERDLAGLLGEPILRHHPLTAVLPRLMAQLSAPPPVLAPDPRTRLAEDVSTVLGSLLGEAINTVTQPDAARRALMIRIRAFMAANLGSSDLTPAAIAAQHRISLRYLHQLFAAEELTAARTIQDARLRWSRRLLAEGRLTITDVAHTTGFVSGAHFSRAFRNAYDMTPREWRHAASSIAPALDVAHRHRASSPTTASPR